jgi:hypothetical protein
MEIVQSDCKGERLIATHGPGEFTGEMTMISEQQCLVLGRVRPANFSKLMARADVRWSQKRLRGGRYPIRSRSVKRSAVGEGSVAVQFAHCASA